MLRFLGIRHLAVIDELEIEWADGLTVLTGETGAGKSIIVEALDLLLGGRASADLVRTGQETARVQAVFERPDGTEIIARREISAAGRSRAFLGGELVTASDLRAEVGPLVDLHGQHEHQALLSTDQHLALLDTFTNRADLLEAGRTAFERFRAAREALDLTHIDARERAARLDVLRFQLQEIDRVAPQAGEDDALAAERTVLANRDRIQRLAGDAYDALYEHEQAVLSTLDRVWRRIAELGDLDARVRPYLETRDPIRSQLQDLAYFLRDALSEVEGGPERLQAVEDRLAALERLKRRFGPGLDDVLRTRERLRTEAEALDLTADRIQTLEAEVTNARRAFLDAASALSRERRVAARELAARVEAELADLALPHARFSVECVEVSGEGQWSATGIDRVEFFLTANPGEAPRPLARTASGGELARIMLALKTVASADQPGKTLVFDEVDAGIGGAAADAVGSRLQQLGRRFQVFCITHLPHVAAHADAHLVVEKAVEDGRTRTSVRQLDEQGTVSELSRMLGGVTQTATVSAAALTLREARRGETMTARLAQQVTGEVRHRSQGPKTARAKASAGRK